MKTTDEKITEQFMQDLFLEGLYDSYAREYRETGKADPDEYRWSLYGNGPEPETVEENIELIEFLLTDIKSLQEEIIRLRYLASFNLKKPYDEYLRADGIDNMPISTPYMDMYQDYISKWHGGKDPLQDRDHRRRCRQYANGKNMTEYIAMMK